MAISLVGSKTFDFTGVSTAQAISLTDLTGGSDTAPSASDLVIVYYSLNVASDIAIGVDTSGYTEVAELYSNDTEDTNLSVSYKVMGGTPDTSVTVSAPPATDRTGVGAIFVLRGVDTSTPIDVTTTTATGINGLLVDPPSITPVTSGAWIVAGGASANNGQAGVSYSSSDLTGFLSVNNNSGAKGATAGVGYHVWTSGAFNPAAFTFSGSTSTAYSWAAVTLAIKPAPALNNYTLTANAGSYSLTGKAAVLTKGFKVTAETGSYALTGVAASLLKTAVLSAATGSYSLTGQSASLKKGSKLTAAAGSYVLTGKDASMYRVLGLTAETGVYTLTGQAASFSRTYRLTAATGNYTLSGQAASLKRGLLLSTSPGAYTVTGKDASLLRKYTLTATKGTYTLSGQAASLKAGRVLVAAKGTYTVSGKAASLKKGYRLVAETGSYTITGKDASFVKTTAGAYTLLADTGEYTITGVNAGLSYSGEQQASSEIITRRRRRRSS